MTLTTVNAGMLDTPAQYTGFKNRIINGGMRVGQRGNVVFTATNNLYGWVDRWLVSISGTTVSALGYQAASQPTSTGYALQVGNTLTTGATTVAVSQRIESCNSYDLSSNSVTFSGKVQQQTGSTQTMNIYINKPNALDNWSSSTNIASTTLSVPTGVWTPFSYTVALGSTDASNGLGVTLAYNSLGAQSNTQFYFADCQLEKGSTATSFDYRDYGRELIMCQRYYEAVNYSGDTVISVGQAISTSQMLAPISWTVVKRATPTISNTATITVWAAGSGSSSVGSLAFERIGVNQCRINCSSVSGSPLVAGNASVVYTSGANVIQISAEL
jgi:hypothetical protein